MVGRPGDSGRVVTTHSVTALPCFSVSRRAIYTAGHRAVLSRAHLAAQWRPWMKQWSVFRRAAWRIDPHWSAYRLKAHAEILKGEGEWVTLPEAASGEIILIDECVADLLGCTVVCIRGDRDYWARARRRSWDQPFYDPDPGIDPDWEEGLARRIEEEDERVEEKINAARERDGELLLLHYLLPHVRLYGKLRALGLSERAYYYHLDAALSTLAEEYFFRAGYLENVQS
jgi:hypothetical protein